MPVFSSLVRAASLGLATLCALLPGRAWAADIAPRITTLQTLTTALHVRGSVGIPMVQASFTAGPSGLASIVVSFVSPGGAQHAVLTFNEGEARNAGQVVMGNTPLTLWAEPGAWQVEAASITDNAGSVTTLSATQLAALKVAPITVYNSYAVDTAPPTVSAGMILTPSVSRSAPNALVGVNLTVADAGSGVAYVALLASGMELANTAPVLTFNGTIGIANAAQQYSAGTYTINGVIVCDLAGNCLQDFDPGHIAAWFNNKASFTITP